MLVTTNLEGGRVDLKLCIVTAFLHHNCPYQMEARKQWYHSGPDSFKITPKLTCGDWIFFFNYYESIKLLSAGQSWWKMAFVEPKFEGKKNANSTLCFVTPEKNLQNLLGGIVKGKE